MFATLDPTIRGVELPSKRKVLFSDTVGFIRHLPHTLVSAFRATLEEVQRATLILQVSDASSPVSAEQDAQVESVLKELEADKKPRLRVMNKIDLLLPKQRESLRDSDLLDNQQTIHVSAAKGIGLSSLLDRIDAVLEGDRPEPRSSAHSAERGQDAGPAAGGRADLFAAVSGRIGRDGSGSARVLAAADAGVGRGVISVSIAARSRCFPWDGRGRPPLHFV